ncbi:sulfatase family protein [Flammeovirga kamogawensis]|uniref:Sulfatase n=1 Tax=Flammeovirga kamogawensis TaxID=373891 RepID=A0ABX8H5A3_9BACT|nr:sulfatase [Flammeovirga kamogawensis]MBB6461697.1 N-sulfoglucosamine sulfohydrolase [Flammeovirga kamogawensis]QWG10617.1 sulfatase [Flammeovirga kamogawensis]TRX63722.1 sulfatase [Flammeovirga kamogawensis]
MIFFNLKEQTKKLLPLFLGCTLVLSFSCQKIEKTVQVKHSNKKQPNVILFVADDHGKDALGCYGNNVIQTPNLDQLSAQGTTFNNAYCTSASCAASRSVILTGKFGHATGSYGHTHDYHHFSTYENEKSLPLLLEEEGYYTARIGKYHLAPEKVFHFEKTLKADQRNTVQMADKCKPVFESEKPFFLYFCTGDPHRGKSTGPNWYDPNSFGNKREGYKGVETVAYKPEDVIVPSFLPDSKESREELAQYYESVSRIDQGFGRLMDNLKASGKLENTIVIYISDNGVAFPGAKTTLYEPGMNLPCIIRDPFIKEKGNTNDAMISWVDLTPTILDYVGADYKEKAFHGKSFKKAIINQDSTGFNEIFASHIFHEITMYYPMRVVRHNNYKLIYNIAHKLDYPFASDLWVSSTWQQINRSKAKYYGKRTVKDYLERDEFELYDLKKDPDEVVNLANNDNYKEVLENMKERMQTFQEETNDPWKLFWSRDYSLQGTGLDL